MEINNMAFGHQESQYKDERAIFETAYDLFLKERKASLTGVQANQASHYERTPGDVSNVYYRISD